MNRFEIWMLKRIAKKVVTQSPQHRNNIIQYYDVIADAADNEFNEDTRPSIRSFLEYLHGFSLDRQFGKPIEAPTTPTQDGKDG